MKNALEKAMDKIDLPLSTMFVKQRCSELEHELKQYTSIMEKVGTTDVSSDADFQREFNAFYKVRRNTGWRSAYYGLFQRCKNMDDLSFSYILRTLCAETGNIEASFSSKLLATLNPDVPIWDSIVLSRLELKPSQATDKDRRLADTETMYQDIANWYQEFLGSGKAQDMIAAFDKTFPGFATISAVKKLDFLLWGSGA